MSAALIELLFWIVVFLVFFFGFRKLQNRKKARDAAAHDKTTDKTAEMADGASLGRAKDADQAPKS